MRSIQYYIFICISSRFFAPPRDGVVRVGYHHLRRTAPNKHAPGDHAVRLIHRADHEFHRVASGPQPQGRLGGGIDIDGGGGGGGGGCDAVAMARTLRKGETHDADRFLGNINRRRKKNEANKRQRTSTIDRREKTQKQTQNRREKYQDKKQNTLQEK